LQQFGELKLSVATNAIEALDYFQKMKELHVRSWTSRKKDHAFRHSYFEIFHRRMIEDYAQSGVAQMLRIAAGEHVVGYLYNFFYRGQVYSYQSGFDVGLNALKPGYICHALAIDHYAKLGAKTYDFLAGTNQLKQSLSNEQYPLFWVRAGRKTLRNRIRAAARTWLQ
jgi:CelD/BcsL family acetyltransferase involved in cellulose biosynthesis